MRAFLISAVSVACLSTGAQAATLEEATQAVECFQLSASASAISQDLFDRFDIQTEPNYLLWKRYTNLFSERASLLEQLLDSDQERMIVGLYQDENEIELVSAVRKIRDYGTMVEKYSFLSSVEDRCLGQRNQSDQE